MADTAHTDARPTMLVDGDTLGALCEITGRRVRQLTTEGVFPKSQVGKFDAFVCVPAFYRWKAREDRRAASSGELDPLQERARKDRALAIQTEMKNDLTRGEVVLIDDVVAQVTGVFGVIRNRFLGLPAKACSRFHTDRRPELQALLHAEVCEILAELSDPAGLDAVKAANVRQGTSHRHDQEQQNGQLGSDGPGGRGRGPRHSRVERGGAADAPEDSSAVGPARPKTPRGQKRG